MANEENRNPETGQDTDISKSQSAQQPQGQDKERQPHGEDSSLPAEGQGESGEAGQAGFGETATEQRSDIEGAAQSSEGGQSSSGFVGSEGQQDTSSELVEGQDFEDDGQGATE